MNEKPVRYSNELPYEKRRFWYFTLHGTGPGTIPKDLHILESREGKNDKGTLGLYICLDGVVNTSELKEFDLREMTPPEEEKRLDEIIDDYLTEKKFSGLYDIWIENNEVHILITDGDWKHQHLACKWLMDEFGYDHINEIDEDSDDDCYTAEHVFVKR